MTGAGDTRRLVIAAIVLVVTALLAARDRLLLGEAALVGAVNGSPALDVFPIKPLLLAVMGFGTLVGVAVVAIAVALLVKPWRPAVGVIAAGVLGWLAARTLKQVVDRGRPLEFLDARTLDLSGGYASITGAGYPSGHTTVAFAVATTLVPWLPVRFRWVPWAVATLVAVARVYVAAHFPLDVIGGAALGMLVGALVNWAIGPPTDEAVDPAATAD